MNRVQLIAIRLLLTTVAGLAPVATWSQSLQGSHVQTIAIRLSSFAFNPDQVLLPVGIPVRLQLINDSTGSHNFSAPEFFATSTFPSGSAPPRGVVDVAARSSAEIVVVPGIPGTYKVECTHFLHSFFGMTGRIVVAGPSR
jgi:plastocyanin